MEKYALVLFDVDGCTDVVEKKKFKQSQDVKQSTRASLRWGMRWHDVEVLKLGESREELNAFEIEWTKSHRAINLDNAKINGKTGGFLSIWPSDEVTDRVAVNDAVLELRSQVEEKRQKKRENERARKVDNLQMQEMPQTQEISTDQVMTLTTQTIEEPADCSQDMLSDQEMPPAQGTPHTNEEPADRINEVLTDQVIPPAISVMPQSAMNTGTKEGTNGRILRVFHEGSGETSERVSHPKRSPFFLQGLSEDEVDLITSSVIQFAEERKSVSTQTNKVVVLSSVADIREIDVTKPDHKDKGIQCDLINDSYRETLRMQNDKLNHILELIQTARETTRSIPRDNDTELESLQFSCMSGDLDTINQADMMETEVNIDCISEIHSVEDNRSQNEQHNACSPLLPSWNVVSPPQQHFNYSDPCKPGQINEISVRADIITLLSDSEVRINPQVSRECRSRACSMGNFGWIVAQKVFAINELVGKNYNGRRGKACISPRRKHAIEHATHDMYGPAFSVKSLSNAINTGIRNLPEAKKRLPFTEIQNNF